MRISIWKTGTAFGDCFPHAFAVVVVDNYHAHWVRRGRRAKIAPISGVMEVTFLLRKKVAEEVSPTLTVGGFAGSGGE